MEKQKKFRDKYLSLTENILKKLRYKVNAYDVETWNWLKVELLFLLAYHVFSIILMETPTPISLYLNTLLVFKFIVGNARENKKIVNKAKRSKRSTKNEYTSMHAMIAIGEVIAAGLMVIMIFILGVENNIGQVQFATIVIMCISFFEGWKDISVSSFNAAPKTF